MYSFYPRIIRDWNNFPVSLIEATSVDEFLTLLSNQLASYTTILRINKLLFKFLFFYFGAFVSPGGDELSAQY